MEADALRALGCRVHALGLLPGSEGYAQAFASRLPSPKSELQRQCRRHFAEHECAQPDPFVDAGRLNTDLLNAIAGSGGFRSNVDDCWADLEEFLMAATGRVPVSSTVSAAAGCIEGTAQDQWTFEQLGLAVQGRACLFFTFQNPTQRRPGGWVVRQHGRQKSREWVSKHWRTSHDLDEFKVCGTRRELEGPWSFVRRVACSR